jgi:hypothetical protein
VRRTSLQARYFDRLLPYLEEDELHGAIFSSVLFSRKLHPGILSLLLESTDPELIKFCGHLLICVENDDDALVTRLLDAYEAEGNVDRRLALANSIGTLSEVPRARRMVETILQGSDSSLMSAALNCFELKDVPDEETGQWIERLRSLALGGGPVSLRVKAFEALNGDRTIEGVRFLLGTLTRPLDPELLATVARALPTLDDELASLAPEALPVLMRLAANEALPPKTRSSAASEIIGILGEHLDLSISPEQRAMVDRLTERPPH